MISIQIIILEIIVMGFLLYLSGWFAGSETALTNITSGQIAELRRKGSKRSGYLLKIRRDMDRTIITILVCNNIVNIVLSVLAALVAQEVFQSIGISIAVGVLTFLIIVFGEIVPKSIALTDNERVAEKNAKALYYLTRSISPLTAVFIWISQKVIGKRRGDGRNLLVSEDRIKALATLGEEEGVLKDIERNIIHSVFEFGDLKVSDVMVPLDQVFMLEGTSGLEKARMKVHSEGFTRIPVTDQEGRVEGVLYSKDLLKDDASHVSELVKKPFKVYKDNDISDVFLIMKENRMHMAIVIDPKGVDVGIITLEDILEELVGDIKDDIRDEE